MQTEPSAPNATVATDGGRRIATTPDSRIHSDRASSPGSPESRGRWDQLRHFHKQPQVIAWWCRAFRPILRQLTPGRRRFLLGLAALYVAIDLPLRELKKAGKWQGIPTDKLGSILVVATLFAFVVMCFLAAKQIAKCPAVVRRHPQICLHAMCWALLMWLWIAPPANPTFRTLLIGVVVFSPFLLWRIGYMFLSAQRGKLATTRLTDHLLYIFPLWRGSETPYGKGWDYLGANEARDEETLARSQLSGVKLLMLGLLCGVGKNLMDGLVFGEDNGYRRALGGFTLLVPRSSELMAHPDAHPRWLCWGALYLDLFFLVLERAAYGHIVIGYLRLFGFNVFRNTYKPLLAESVVEFWNRYYYYFKELLVNFFFFPTFTRYLKKQPRLRLLAAVFMAAFLGNVYYHWLDDQRALITGDFSAMWLRLQSRLFYCLLLAIGIYISMLREQRRVRNKITLTGPRRAAAIFGVWTFFSIIHIWAYLGPETFVARMKLFARLVGLD